MLFASFDFLIFFAVAFTGYWLLKERAAAQAILLTLGSYFFYAAGPKPTDGPLPTPWYFVGLLILSTIVDFVCGFQIDRIQQNSTQRSHSSGTPERPERRWLILSLLSNLGLLGYFKYTGFIFEVAEELSTLLGQPLALPALQVALPVGISFYTFQSLSYTIDVYRGHLKAEKSLLRFAFFVSFFPQLVAGPIVRASEFLPQLRVQRSISRIDVDAAVFRITRGLLKKVILGDFIAVYFSDIIFASPSEYSSLENLLALYAFTLQIYADFSGYSDIAIGIARLLGFHLPENFERPYQATDIADFWRRWHMTLSRWLRDYLYFPLGGSRGGSVRTYINLWVTMFLVGMWHGASWNFVIYSNLQAAAMLYHRYVSRRKRSVVTLVQLFLLSVALGLISGWFFKTVMHLEASSNWAFIVFLLSFLIGSLPQTSQAPQLRPIHIFLTLHFSVLSRIFFRSESLENARIMLHQLTQFDGLGVRDGLFRIQGLATWANAHHSFQWLEPIAHFGILVLLIGGFTIHYIPSARIESVAMRVIQKTPGFILGIGFAGLLGVLSVLLSGPRANIYFAF